MRESVLMERYAQRAIDKRRKDEDANRKIGSFLLIQYHAQGGYLCEALKKMSQMERQIYISKHTELIESSDGAEGINVVWCPNSQVLTHRLLTAEMRKEHEGRHYLGSWVRRVGPHQREALRAQLRQRLEVRVAQRQHQKNQLVMDFNQVQAS
ncbi:hypothetical protein [Pseudomonas putida]|uniref:Uncharacterized protein n=1 Tax=Pseudomonas putida TaxID=303 RepID=A0A1X0ZNX1_PSEPU|nr:hypothetical protein [Pseudomonas putida]ORL59870.1 hypothetical protein B7H17_23740 [Pseudomonas putida]